MYPSDPLEDEQKAEDEFSYGKFIRHIDLEATDLAYMQQRGIQYIYETDHDFVCIKRSMMQKQEFYDFYQKALDSYIDGDWVNSQSNLRNCEMTNPLDGPLRWLSEYLESNKSLAPDNWKGFRDLEKKQEVPEFGITKNEGGQAEVDQDANPEQTSPSHTEVNSPTSVK